MDATQQILTALQELHELHPAWRFGQLVANVSIFARGPVNTAVWDVEDEEFLQAAQAHLSRVEEKKRETVAV